jgi:hypothetical protein
MTRITFDVDDTLIPPFGRMYDGTAAHRTVRTDGGGFFGILDLKRFGLLGRRKQTAFAGLCRRSCLTPDPLP